MKLDRVRSTLRICGSEASIQAVRKQLASLCGPRKPVSAAVWAELMRTRTMQDPQQAVVARLEQETGCRVHIERSSREVRLFGPSAGAALAARRLDELDRECAEEVVPVGVCAFTAESLQALAHACGVTLRVEEAQVVVLGLRDAVVLAAEELRTVADGAQAGQAAAKVLGALGHSVPDKMVREVPRETHSPAHGVVTTKMPRAPSPVGSVADAPAGRVHNHAHRKPQAPKPWHNQRSGGGGCLKGCGHGFGAPAGACPTCGAGNFCSHCGAPTWSPQSSMSLGDYSSYMAAKPSATYTDVGSCDSSGHPGTPDSDTQGPPWVQWMAFDGNMQPRPAAMMPGRLVPVCFTPTQVPQGVVPVCFTQGHMIQYRPSSGAADGCAEALGT